MLDFPGYAVEYEQVAVEGNDSNAQTGFHMMLVVHSFNVDSTFKLLDAGAGRALPCSFHNSILSGRELAKSIGAGLNFAHF
mmetsp:Transcript_30471/g.50479  ORF Transcript_30471/g.50479 Transcript_30471/m.50479 type:complete len:81 (+) Transcript_30471:131-373(+)